MKCPICKDVTLLMSEKKEIEIDYCPECRGIWLDRGELEKLMEKEESRIEEVEKTATKKSKEETKPHKRESFLSEIFEMFGE